MYFEIEGPVFVTSIFTFTGWLCAKETIEMTSQEHNSTANSEFLLFKDITISSVDNLCVERCPRTLTRRQLTCIPQKTFTVNLKRFSYPLCRYVPMRAGAAPSSRSCAEPQAPSPVLSQPTRLVLPT